MRQWGRLRVVGIMSRSKGPHLGGWMMSEVQRAQALAALHEAAVAFFHEHAGSSYYPDRETEAEGRLRGAKALAAAEAWLAEQDGSTEWAADDDADRSGIDHDAPLYQCVVEVACDCDRKYCSGKRCESLSGIDLGDNGDNTYRCEDYMRVVVAELALELMDAE